MLHPVATYLQAKGWHLGPDQRWTPPPASLGRTYETDAAMALQQIFEVMDQRREGEGHSHDENPTPGLTVVTPEKEDA